MKKQNAAVHTVLALILTLTIISLSVVITLAFRPLYYMDISLLDIPGYTGYSSEEIRENYDVLIDYNMAFEDDYLEFPTLPMSDEARTHFAEVKDIFDLFKYMAVGGVILSAVFIFVMHRRREYLYLKITSIVSIVLPVVLGLFVLINWDWVFVTFHEVVFDNNYWIFNPATDPIIDMLPDEFFMHCAILILVLIVVGSIVCALCYRRAKKKISAES